MSARRGTPIAAPLRVWLWIEVLFGLAAIASVGLRPQDTETGFAWHIEPLVMAAALGGLYIAATPSIVLQALAGRWEMIRVLIPTAICFTTAELVATLLHLDKFSVGTAPFFIWLASYVLPPPSFIAMYAYHQRRAEPLGTGVALPPPLRRTLIVIGALLTLDAIVGFAFPEWFTGSFPWELTPLTARVLCGWLIAVGTLMLSIARENDRDRVRLASPMLILLLPAVGLQVARFAGQVDLSNPRLWIGAAIFGFTAGCGLYLARGSWRTSLG